MDGCERAGPASLDDRTRGLAVRRRPLGRDRLVDRRPTRRRRTGWRSRAAACRRWCHRASSWWSPRTGSRVLIGVLDVAAPSLWLGSRWPTSAGRPSHTPRCSGRGVVMESDSGQAARRCASSCGSQRLDCARRWSRDCRRRCLAASYVLGVLHPRILTCEDFAVSGNFAPPTCTLGGPRAGVGGYRSGRRSVLRPGDDGWRARVVDRVATLARQRGRPSAGDHAGIAGGSGALHLSAARNDHGQRAGSVGAPKYIEAVVPQLIAATVGFGLCFGVVGTTFLNSFAIPVDDFRPSQLLVGAVLGLRRACSWSRSWSSSSS